MDSDEIRTLQTLPPVHEMADIFLPANYFGKRLTHRVILCFIPRSLDKGQDRVFGQLLMTDRGGAWS